MISLTLFAVVQWISIVSRSLKHVGSVFGASVVVGMVTVEKNKMILLFVMHDYCIISVQTNLLANIVETEHFANSLLLVIV